MLQEKQGEKREPAAGRAAVNLRNCGARRGCGSERPAGAARAALPGAFTESVLLNGATGREALAAAAKELARLLAERLRRKGLAYLAVALEAQTEEGAARAESRFGQGRPAEELARHLVRLGGRLEVRAPLERLTATVASLVPVAVEQPALFGAREGLRRLRLERLLAEVNRKHRLERAAALLPDRREKMLAFYDPWRFAAGQGRRPPDLEEGP